MSSLAIDHSGLPGPKILGEAPILGIPRCTVQPQHFQTETSLPRPTKHLTNHCINSLRCIPWFPCILSYHVMYLSKL